MHNTNVRKFILNKTCKFLIISDTKHINTKGWGLSSFYLDQPGYPCPSLLPGEGEVLIAEEEKVHWDAESDVYVDGDWGTGPRIVIHQDHLTW